MNNLYYKVLGEKIVDCPQIKVSSATDNQIKDCVVEVVGVRDLGQLRDKFEGQAFLDDKLFKLQAYNACLNYLGKPLPKISKDYIENFKPIIRSENEILVMVPFRVETLPNMRIMEYKQPRIFVLHKGGFMYSIMGIASLDVLNNKSNYTNIDSSGLTGDFIGFDKLKLNF